jgi:hypothetical protein
MLAAMALTEPLPPALEAWEREWRAHGAESVSLELKGKSAPVAARVVDLSGSVEVPDDERPTRAEHVAGRVSHDV